MKPKIPKQLYVVSKLIREYAYVDDKRVESELHQFGFLHPHDTTKADAKRKKTQYDWAYGQAPFLKDGVLHTKKYKWPTDVNEFTGRWEREYYDQPIDKGTDPVVWDNVPLTGFRIIDTVCRYRGNKLFKVMDPRGIEFEITVASLFEILMNGTVIKGVIQEPCLWKANKNLIIYT